MTRTAFLVALAGFGIVATAANNTPQLGYYRFPALHNDTLVFTAEGDLWRVEARGGAAERLTTHPAEELRPAISPDGNTLAFSASYEGPTEVYTMPIGGGVPARQTWEGGDAALVAGWTPAGEVLFSTRRFSGLPDAQLGRVNPASGERGLVPLSQAADGTYDQSATLFFTRLPFQGSHAKRYKGGTAQNIWKLSRGAAEAAPLTADYAGTSKVPMPWNGRVYFLNDRDGTMNIWSMNDSGKDLKQHTTHSGWDVQNASLSRGRIAYQLGADLRLLDVASGSDSPIPIRLTSDFDQLRERWVRTPMEWVSAAHLSPSGDRVVLTARGQVFVVPAEEGRFVEATRNKRVRHREAKFMPDGKSIVALSDESGEIELWRIPANGVGAGERLTTDGKVLRWNEIPSPDGKLIAHNDKDQQLWILDASTKQQKKIAFAPEGDFDDLAWSPDSKWLAYTVPSRNLMTQVFLYSVASGAITPLTSDRYDSFSPAWSPDGKWIYFFSNRHFVSVVPAPWGSRQPEPFFDKQTKLYQVPLTKDERSPFQPADELMPAAQKTGAKETAEKADDKAEAKPADKPAVKELKVDLENIQQRLIEVPLAPGNYNSLSTDGKRLYFLSADAGPDPKRALRTLAIESKKPQPETFLEDVRSYELSLDGKKLLVRKADDLYVLDAGPKAPSSPADLAKKQVQLKDWTFRFDPRDEWRQMYTEAWRLHRDYFYDRGMHGIDWATVREKYLPLVDRVTDRAELSDIVAQMISELSALHAFVRGGDMRRGQDQVLPGSLGARFVRDEKTGGFRVERIYKSDPDLPDEVAPLARVGVDVREGDVIESVNGAPALGVPDISQLLRQQADKQVLLRIKPKSGAASRDVIVTPITQTRESDLRYDEWEFTRRLETEKLGGGRIGYVHLRAMGTGNMAEWTREFYPVFDREGLIVDVRHNRGGNIDSWILEKLLRKAWFYWQPRVGNPIWNMQFAFRGHVVVLCNEWTASDGEAFAEGFRRLGLGKVIGTRTWGGEIWLSGTNFMVDRGVATAAETGVYGPEGQWLIEGHGVDPDMVVDNLPHETFKGRDAQLEAAVKFLQEEIKKKPVPLPTAPKYPIKKTTS